MTKNPGQQFFEKRSSNLQLSGNEDSPGVVRPSQAEMILEKGNRSENNLLQSCAEYSYPAFVDSIHEGALILSPERMILCCNNHFARLLSRTAEQVIGSHLEDYIQPVDILKLTIALNQHPSANNTLDISCRPVNGDLPVALRLSVSSFGGAKARGMLFLIAYDISGFIRTETELRQAQITAENSIAERTSKLIRVNEDLGASRIATLSMMEDAVEAKNNLEKTNIKLVAEIVERKRSELIHQVLFRISNAALITGDIEELISIIRLELGKLLDTQNFYIAFYDEASDTLSAPYVEDEKDTIDTWPAAKSLTGHVIKSRKKLLVTRENMQELIRLGTIELVGIDSEVWLGVPLDVDGRTIGAFVVQSYDDANAYDTKDVEMLEFISHQISISIQRKKAEQDLKIALAKAEESDRLKTAFLQNISHEIRTPMNAILGFSELLNEPDLEPEARKSYTEIIGKSGRHLITIIEDIINTSQLEAGREVLLPVKTSLNTMLRDIYEQYRIKTSKKNIELKLITTLADGQATIITDETKLVQIISNLLNNALKFTRQGSIRYGYTLMNGQLEFHVEDTGVGIAGDKCKMIFERFKQVEIVLSSENGGRGLGLGLSIAKAYVELLGGRIWLKSEPGKGSVFYFSIPYTPVALSAK